LTGSLVTRSLISVEKEVWTLRSRSGIVQIFST
jgi:hypothetical protein